MITHICTGKQALMLTRYMSTTRDQPVSVQPEMTLICQTSSYQINSYLYKYTQPIALHYCASPIRLAFQR